jgi:hypothetical protein
VTNRNEILLQSNSERSNDIKEGLHELSSFSKKELNNGNRKEATGYRWHGSSFPFLFSLTV